LLPFIPRGKRGDQESILERGGKKGFSRKGGGGGPSPRGGTAGAPLPQKLFPIKDKERRAGRLILERGSVSAQELISLRGTGRSRMKGLSGA